MNKLSTFLFGLCLVIFLSSCASQRRAERLTGHKDVLQQAMYDKEMSPELKLDILAGSMVDVMNEGMNIVNVRKGGKYVQQYFGQNNSNIQGIVTEIVDWQQGLSKAERTTLGLRMLTKPYTKDLVMLVPKFVAKYKAYSTVIKGANRLKRGLLKMGGGLLDFGSGNGGFEINNK